MEENVIQINVGITINVDVSVKNIYVKKIIFGIQVHVVVKNKKYFTSIMDDSKIMCDEIIESYGEEIKIVPTNFNEKNNNLYNAKFLYFTSIFIDFYDITGSC